ncbi:MAG TPA: FHA domain-containing protein, partial [Nannocystis sp.]
RIEASTSIGTPAPGFVAPVMTGVPVAAHAEPRPAEPAPAEPVAAVEPAAAVQPVAEPAPVFVPPAEPAGVAVFVPEPKPQPRASERGGPRVRAVAGEIGETAALATAATAEVPIPEVPASEWSPPAAPRVSQAPSTGPAPAPRRDPGASRLRLVVVQRDGSEGEVVPLGDAPLTIGRWQGDLRFPADEFLGSPHARVDPLPTGVRISDLATRNGIFVRISRPEPVFPGDLFLLGHHLLRLENIPAAGREQDPGPDGVRGFGTPLQPAWGRLVLLGPGGVEAETHYLRHPQVVFGRELGDIVFPADPFVSWQHAQLSVEVAAEAMRVTLTDLRSANGTYLRARGDVILDPGDMFRVGDQIFRVRMH